MLNAPTIFDLVNDRPESDDAKDVWDFLQRNFEAARQLDINNQELFLDSIHIPGETYLAILEEVNQHLGLSDINYGILGEVQRLCEGLAYFPPANFEDNVFTMHLKQTLKKIDKNFQP
ncbi:MAG: hypothetical protein HQK53_17160 [Oligoflexia bacterium]|nr:hypothetical protein [Oligoflexia bacterium]